jgi:hypothetical protein
LLRERAKSLLLKRVAHWSEFAGSGSAAAISMRLQAGTPSIPIPGLLGMSFPESLNMHRTTRAEFRKVIVAPLSPT